MRRFFLVFLLFGCGELIQQTGESCSLGTDCVWPAVCCSAPRIPAIDDPIPLCEDIMYCDAFLPFLVEDNPCHRATMSVLESCSEGLVCCPKTLTCLDEAGCAEAPEPPAATTSPSGQRCNADPDCPEGELCMGISMLQRSGTCAPFGSMPVLP